MEYSARVVELLGLRTTDDGLRRMRIGIAWEDRQAFFEAELDELTYGALEALRPVQGERVRLSPYPKWDPYRHTYYGAMVRMAGVSRDTLYFACSEAFAGLMTGLRRGELPQALEPVRGEWRQQGLVGEDAAAAGLQQLPHGELEEAGAELRTDKARAAGTRELYRGEVEATGTQPRHGKAGSQGADIGVLRGGWWRAEATQLAVRLLLAGGLFGALAVPSAGIGWSNRAGAVSRDEVAPAATVQEQEPAPAVESIAAESVSVAVDVPAAALVGPAAEASVVGTQEPEPGDDVVSAHAQMIDISGGKEFFELPQAYVALTFDDGPSALTRPIVDMLTEAGVTATFLFVGKNAERRPEDVAYVSEHGMAVGNHSWDHSVLTKAESADQRSNLAKTNTVLEAATHTPVTVFRPPYGAVNDTLLASAKAERLNTLLWNRDPEDWNAKKPEDILRYFREVEAAGGVYVLHEDKNTVAALPDIIRLLKEKDLTFVAFE